MILMATILGLKSPAIIIYFALLGGVFGVNGAKRIHGILKMEPEVYSKSFKSLYPRRLKLDMIVAFKERYNILFYPILSISTLFVFFNLRLFPLRSILALFLFGTGVKMIIHFLYWRFKIRPKLKIYED